MALSPDLHQDIDTTRPFSAPDNPAYLSDEIRRVQEAIQGVDAALKQIPSPALPTLQFGQLLIRNRTEVGMMSEGDLLQEMANVTSGLLKCDELLAAAGAPASSHADPDLIESAKIVANELHAISTRDLSDHNHELHCFCRLPYSSTRSMIQCDSCDNWFHLICTGMSLLALPSTFRCCTCYETTTKKGRAASQLIPDDIIQPEIDLKLCSKGLDWLQEEVRRTELDLATLVEELCAINGDLASIEKSERSRANRAARKIAKEHEAALEAERLQDEEEYEVLEDDDDDDVIVVDDQDTETEDAQPLPIIGYNRKPSKKPRRADKRRRR